VQKLQISKSIYVTANTPTSADEVVITNLTVTGDVAVSACTSPQNDVPGPTAIENTDTSEYFNSIQDAIDDCDTENTHEITVAAGTYIENVVVNKEVYIVGAGKGVTNVEPASGVAIQVLEDNVSVSDLSAEGPTYAFEVKNVGGTVNDLALNEVEAHDSNVGLKVDSNTSIDGLEVTNSNFDDNGQGWTIAAANGAGTSVDNVTVTDTTFNNNTAKGVYIEKLDNALFDGITVDGSGNGASNGSGFNVNLKFGDYSNIALTNSTINNSGVGITNGTGVHITARDDGTTYGGNPATLDGVTLENNNITNNEVGVRFGEPAKGNAGPANVEVNNNNILNNIVIGLDNQTAQPDLDGEKNWWGDDRGPSGVGAGTGDIVSASVTFEPWLCGPFETNPAFSVGGSCPKFETLVEVTGDTAAGENQLGWLFNRDLANATPIEFNIDEMVIGNGALYILPLSNTDGPRKFIGEYFWGGLIDNLDAFSYDFKIGSGGVAADEHQFYLNVYANYGESDTDKYYDCKYDVVPTVGSTGAFTTVTFDPTQSYPVTTLTGKTWAPDSPYTCPSVPAEMDLQSPDSTFRAFAVNLDDTVLGDADLDGYFDNVVLETDTEITTFDFEPLDAAKPVTEVTAPVNGLVTNSDFDITVHSTDDVALTKMVVNLKDAGGANLSSCMNESVSGIDQTRSCTVDVDALAEGLYGFKANAKDDSGNTSNTVSQSFIVDKTGPTITVKPTSIGGAGVYSNVSFGLFDEYKVDKLTLNGVPKDLSDNKWSDLNFVKDGAFGGVEGTNTLVVYDVAGNSTTLVFTLIIPVNSLVITNPAANGETLSGIVTFEALYDDVDEVEDAMYWAIRAGSCNGADMVGNTPASPFHDSAFSSSTGEFSTTVDMRDWNEGDYCLVVNPAESTGNDTRETRTFTLEDIDPSLIITKPATDGEVLSGTYTFEAEYIDDDSTEDVINWAVYAGSCTHSGLNRMAGDAAGDPSSLVGSHFSATVDTSAWEEDDDYCFVVNPKEEVGEDDFRATRIFEVVSPVVLQCEMLSDEDTVIVESNDFATLGYQHPNWSADITGADWIWNSYYVIDPETEETLTFEETFTVASVDNAILDVAADNGYVVYINGVLVIDRSGLSNNFQTHTQKEIDVTSYLVAGDNTMQIIVTNSGTENSTSVGNPAGLLYKLTVNGTDECSVTTDTEEELTRVEGYKWNDVDGDGEWNNGEEAVLGWTIYAISDEYGLRSTTTNANGYYYFDVPEDEWEISENDVEGWLQTGLVDYMNVEASGTSCTFEVGSEIAYKTLLEPDYRCDFGNQEIPEELLPTCNLSTSATKVEKGDFVTLSWDVEGALSSSIDQGIGAVNETGNLEVQINDDTTFTMTIVDSESEESSCSVTIEGFTDGNRSLSDGNNSAGTAETGAESVLGASTSAPQCGMFIYDYMNKNQENNIFEVKKLQLFLLSEKFYSVGLTGIFDEMTETAVKSFQTKNSADVLMPWVENGFLDEPSPTGHVYKTTRWKINDLVCPGSEVFPDISNG